jgi:hypothetical protein
VVAATSLAQPASLGCAEDVTARLALHRVGRAAFGAIMAAVDQHPAKR